MAKHGDADGRDLVATNGGGFPIRRKVRADGWTKTRRQTFLNTLAATCNVTESCRAAGMALRAVYPLKARDAEFAAAWDQAITEGFDRLRAQALDAGANAALIGDELVQFARAEPLGGARWRISGFWRGRRGTEGAMGAQAAGTRFVLIDQAALLAVDLPPGTIGRVVDASASGVGDAAPVPASADVTGRSVAPPAPEHARVAMLGDGGLQIGWMRRSRTGWAWRDGVDAPLGEEREAYRLTITRGDGVVRTIETAIPGWTYPAGALADDRSAGPVSLAVVQIGTLAASVPLIMTI